MKSYTIRYIYLSVNVVSQAYLLLALFSQHGKYILNNMDPDILPPPPPPPPLPPQPPSQSKSTIII
ncbi:hypothetical protein DERF_012490 [Dermatophagoides farinae]|uniref:Uncharacterized protein n=1 Tax=Dermatophagoides farinae TaxID=6954 RepID=A0A922HPN4_DERFA|nr:hypothetical protein DERF_012490 [Dermatophagoides farinae]